jgi:hypothetical protein
MFRLRKSAAARLLPFLHLLRLLLPLLRLHLHLLPLL